MGELFAIIAIVLVGSAVYIAQRRVRSGAFGAQISVPPHSPKKGSLGAYSAEQWQRILPAKPGSTVWIGPKKPGPVEPSFLNELSADIDRALDVFYSGGEPEEVEKHLLQARIKIKLGEDKSGTYTAYDKDQRPYFIGIIDEIEGILRVVTDRNGDDHRLKILAARLEDIKEISLANVANNDGMIERIASAFEDDERVFDVEWNSGYHYTTGESSGNAAVLAEEGAIEVGNFGAKCLIENYPEVLSKFKELSIYPDDRATISLRMTGSHFGDGSVGSFIGIASRLREDERVFGIERSTSRSYNGPEGTDDNHTLPEDIDETHYLVFSCHKTWAADLVKDMEELVRGVALPVTVSVKYETVGI